jgi:hypothetical protein
MGPKSGGSCRRDFWRRADLAGCAQIVGRRFARTAIGYDFVADLLAFTQSSKAGAFHSADVYEHIVAAVIRLDKAVALGRVKPLYGSHAHGIVPSQYRHSEAHFRGLVRSNFWKGRQRLNRLYRWIANVVRPKIDKLILFQSSAPNNPEVRDFLIAPSGLRAAGSERAGTIHDV